MATGKRGERWHDTGHSNGPGKPSIGWPINAGRAATIGMKILILAGFSG
jgi:hypothetical protein